jgi:hypothetical protein
MSKFFSKLDAYKLGQLGFLTNIQVIFTDHFFPMLLGLCIMFVSNRAYNIREGIHEAKNDKRI